MPLAVGLLLIISPPNSHRSASARWSATLLLSALRANCCARCSGGGYGICGHKNAYNAGVKDGNWVEDKVGQDLAANRPRPKQTTISEQKSNYIHPADMPQKHATGPTYVDSQSRKGLNRDVLFNHGPDIFGSQEKVPSSSAGKELLRTRSNTLNREQYQVRASSPLLRHTSITFCLATYCSLNLYVRMLALPRSSLRRTHRLISGRARLAPPIRRSPK